MHSEKNKLSMLNGTFDPERLKSVRESLGINKAEAARRLDLSKMGYGRYENGQRTPSTQMIEFMAQHLGTNFAYLTGLNDDPAPDYILITRQSDSKLFELVEAARKSDPEKIDRLLHYFKSMQ